MRQARARGVTLTEMLVVVLILGIVIAPLYFVMQNTASSQQTVVTENDLQKEGRAVMDAITESLLTSTGLTAVDNSGFTARFPNGSTIKYYRAGQTLRKDFKPANGTTTTTVLTNRLLASPPGPALFRYFKFYADYTDPLNPVFTFVEIPSTGDRTQADRIQVELVLTSGNSRVSQRSSVWFRNKF